MTKVHRSIRGSAAMPVILLLVSVVAIGLFGWFYVTQLAPKDEAPTAGMVFESPHTDEGAPVIQQSEMPSINGEQQPGAAEEESVPAPEVSSAPVAIDVAKATGVRAIGNVNAPVKIIEYASLTCSHCAHFHNEILPALKTKYIDTGKVYLEFREFPLDDAAMKATLTARCLPEDKYESFVALLFKSQEQWARNMDYLTSLRQNAKLAGMSDAVFDACQKEPMLKLKIAENMQEAKDKWKINATPTFIVNDGAETIQGAQPLENFERVFRKITDGAVGEAPAVE
ncbi:MAG TPA: DsbA family protein [Micavibrio sp.]|nr:DsbA family protein [Micavibrio sp.]